MDVYCKEQLLTKEDAEKVVSDVLEWEKKWVEVAVTKDIVTATRIVDILDKYGFNVGAQHIRGKCAYSHLCV